MSTNARTVHARPSPKYSTFAKYDAAVKKSAMDKKKSSLWPDFRSCEGNVSNEIIIASAPSIDAAHDTTVTTSIDISTLNKKCSVAQLLRGLVDRTTEAPHDSPFTYFHLSLSKGGHSRRRAQTEPVDNLVLRAAEVETQERRKTTAKIFDALAKLGTATFSAMVEPT